jgi:hypothetical protein
VHYSSHQQRCPLRFIAEPATVTVRCSPYAAIWTAQSAALLAALFTKQSAALSPVYHQHRLLFRCRATVVVVIGIAIIIIVMIIVESAHHTLPSG